MRARNAELLWVYIDVESVPFNRGFYAVDVKYFYRITADAFNAVGRSKEICGLAAFDRRSILFGSEGGARIFSSKFVSGEPDIQACERSNMPIAVVEVVDPIILSAKIVDRHHSCGCCCCPITEVPSGLGAAFDDDIMLHDDCKRLFVTLGQFSIIRLERDIQLLMPAYDICMPEKECSGTSPSGEEDPCETFSQFEFPIDEFFPPKNKGNKGMGCDCCGCADTGNRK